MVVHSGQVDLSLVLAVTIWRSGLKSQVEIAARLNPEFIIAYI